MVKEARKAPFVVFAESSEKLDFDLLHRRPRATSATAESGRGILCRRAEPEKKGARRRPNACIGLGHRLLLLLAERRARGFGAAPLAIGATILLKACLRG